VLPSRAGRKLQGSLGVSGRPRYTNQLLTTRNSAIEPLQKTMDFKESINNKMREELQIQDPQKIMAGPPSLVYADF
jgi:hypothetical protein